MSDTATMNVVDWLRACLDEDETKAKAAIREPYEENRWMGRPGDWGPVEVVDDGVWSAGDHASDSERVEGIGITIFAEGGHTEEQAQHIARHDPASVLARVKADRRILDEYTESASRTVAHGAPSNYEVRTAALADVIQILAEAYADRPGYDESWRLRV